MGRVPFVLGMALAASGTYSQAQAPPVLREAAGEYVVRVLVAPQLETSLASPMLGRILDACPGVKLLVTSRVRLMVAAEWTLPVEGLPCPEHEDEDRLEAFDAARLFVAVARKVAPSLSPAREAAAIVDICRQVGGMPLAFRLAAASAGPSGE